MSSEEMISASRAADLKQVAKELAAARTSGVLMDDLGGTLRVLSMAEAYYVHREMVQREGPDSGAGYLGPVGGWKVGAPTADATPAFAPMPLRWINRSATKPGEMAVIERHRYRAVEAEIAFYVGVSLPPRGTNYSREEIVAAMASCHPAIELLEAPFPDPDAVEKFSQVADLQSNGGFVPGPKVDGWQQIDFAKEGVQVIVDGAVEVERVASNSAGTDLLRLVEWLVNVGSVGYGGVKAGDWITTGSWTGKTQCALGAVVEVRFSTAGSVKMKFASA